MKGVITAVDSGTQGVINCGKGVRFSFDESSLTEGYRPILKDIVEFESENGYPVKVRLYYRDKAVEQDENSVDLRIQCPYCSQYIVPQAKVVNGKMTHTVCPECGGVLSVIPQENRSVNRIYYWWIGFIVVMVIALAVAFSY